MKKEFYRGIFLNGLLATILLLFCVDSNGQKKLTQFTDKNKKMGYKDEKGNIAIPAKYDFAGDFYYDRAIISLNKKWGVIDVMGREIVVPKYDTIGKDRSPSYSNGMVEVKLKNKWGFIDVQGREVIPIKYEDARFFQEGLAPVKLNNRWGFIDKNDKVFIDFKYQTASTFEDSVSVVQLNNKWGVIYWTGRELIPIKYEELALVRPLGFWYGWMRARLNNKWGFIHIDGSILVPFKYDDLKGYVMYFEEGEIDTADLLQLGDYFEEYEMVNLKGKWGTIDYDGNEAIPIKYQDIWNEGNTYLMFKGWFRVKLNNKWGLVDAFGRELIAFQNTDPFFKIDSNAVNRVAATYAKATPKTNSGPNGAPQSNQQQTKIITPPLTMKGIIDPAIVGTWKYHDDAMNFNGFYIFRADGTYDYYADMITPNPPAPTYKNFWRVDGDYMEFFIDGKKDVLRQKVLRRNDPQYNKAALVIPWNSATQEYRTYYPTQAHELWATGSTSQKATETSGGPASVIKPIEPPVHLNGTVDPTIAGLWKGTLNNIDYFLDIKPDGTYSSYSSNNKKPFKCYWRINGEQIEVACEGMTQISKWAFRKTNDLNLGKPTISFDGFKYYSETAREMWK